MLEKQGASGGAIDSLPAHNFSPVHPPSHMAPELGWKQSEGKSNWKGVGTPFLPSHFSPENQLSHG